MLYNRDLSWISFNRRVLMEAEDSSLPLYERIKFLAIFSSNMDEFFRIRYPQVLALSKLSQKTISKEGFLSESDLSALVHDTISGHQEEYGRILHEHILPELNENNIHFYYKEPFLKEHESAARQIFVSDVLSFIQPVILNEEKPGKFLPENNELFLFVTTRTEQDDKIQHVLVNIPASKLKRFYVLPQVGDKNYVAFVDDIIRENLTMFFPNKIIDSVYSIKINRNADVDWEDDLSVNILDKVEKKLTVREKGNTTRLLIESGMPLNLKLFLAGVTGTDAKNIFEGGRYHNLSDLFGFPTFNPALQKKSEPAEIFPPEAVSGDIFNLMDKRDVLLHLPYQSYAPVLAFFNQAAIDENVTDIAITLYRVAKESHIVNALISAAKNGKNVVAFVELKARFDEANNIRWSRIMKKAGVKLIYSDPAIKVHSKVGLVRKNNGQQYAVISTGNFNESTASFYTDHVLLTSNESVCKELSHLFQLMSDKKQDYKKLAKHTHFENIYVSQFNLVPAFEAFINEEIKKVEAGQQGLIRIKVNNLEDPEIIKLLYRASGAGVQVQLIVRSICCIVPGVEGLSEHIEVRRLVDHYLEHSRIFIFGTDDNAKVLMGSSDLMIRNLRRRIEVCIELKDPSCRQQIIDYFSIQWADNVKAVWLNEKMEQSKVLPKGSQLYRAQSDIRQYLKQVQ